MQLTLEQVSELIDQDGDLDLTRRSDVTGLPDNLTVDGSLYLSNCTGMFRLPNNLIVKRALDLCGTNISMLPDDLIVDGSLFIYGCPITIIPPTIKVGGYIHVG